MKTQPKLLQKLLLRSLLFLLILPIKAFCQINITGQIKNQNNKVVELIEVLLIKEQSPVKSVMSDKSGKFTILALADKYSIKIKQNGKILFNKDIDLIKNIDLGTIQIETVEMLKEVSIKNYKKLIEYKGDKLIFNVENSIAATGGDVVDILKATPCLIVQENSITLVGKSYINVMINNRISSLSGEDLINMLKSIPSDNVSKVEVINSPSAKYDAEGDSGLVNIVLKKAKNNSYNGNIKTSYTQAMYDTETIGAGLNYQKDKLTFVSNFDFSKGITAPLQTYDIYYPNYNWKEIYKNNNLRNIDNQRIVLDYKISKKTIIGLEFNRINNASNIDGENESKIFSSQLDSITITNSIKNIDRKTNSINFHSLTTLDTIGKSLSFDFDYFKYDYTINNDFDITTYLPSGLIKPNRSFFANNNGEQGIKIYSSKVDFTLPLKWVELSIGGKISYLKNGTQTLFYNILSQTYIYDDKKSNHFNYDENNNAVYISADRELTKKWYLQLGIRFENTVIKSYSFETNQTNANNYNQYFPSFYLSYTAENQTTFTLNYSKRIERPNYNLLIPFRAYTTNQNYFVGNPDLMPYFSNSIKLSCAKNNFNHSVFFNYTSDGIDQITYVDNLQNAQVTTPLNFFVNKKIGLTEYYSYQKLKFWQSNTNITIFHTQTDSSLKTTLPTQNGWTGYISSNNNFTLNKSKSLKVEINFVYQTTSLSNSYKSSAYSNFDAGIKYSLLSNNLQFSLNLNDIFKTSGITFTNSINNILQEKYNYSDSQKIRFSAIYKFGKSFKENKRETSNEDEKNRVK